MQRTKLIRFFALVVLAVFVGLMIWSASKTSPEFLHGDVEVREIKIASKVAGRISEVLVEEGQQVQAAEGLAEHEDADRRRADRQHHPPRLDRQAGSYQARLGHGGATHPRVVGGVACS